MVFNTFTRFCNHHHYLIPENCHCWKRNSVPSKQVLSHISHVWLFATLRTIACQAPLSMAFSKQEYWSGLPCPPPGNLPGPGIEPLSPAAPAWQVDSLSLSCQGSPYPVSSHSSFPSPPSSCQSLIYSLHLYGFASSGYFKSRSHAVCSLLCPASS